MDKLVERLQKDAVKVKEILEMGDNRLMAGDGPCGGQLPQLSPEEWGKIYQACKRIAKFDASALTPDSGMERALEICKEVKKRYTGDHFEINDAIDAIRAASAQNAEGRVPCRTPVSSPGPAMSKPDSTNDVSPVSAVSLDESAPATQLAPSAPDAGQVVVPVGDLLDRNEAAVKDYVEDYVMEGDEGYYTPNETERALIMDAIQGLLADDDFVKTWADWRNAVAAQRAAGSRP